MLKPISGYGIRRYSPLPSPPHTYAIQHLFTPLSQYMRHATIICNLLHAVRERQPV